MRSGSNFMRLFIAREAQPFFKKSPFSFLNEGLEVSARFKKASGGGGSSGSKKGGKDEVFTSWKNVDITPVKKDIENSIEKFSSQLRFIRIGSVGTEVLGQYSINTPRGSFSLSNLAMITLKDPLTLNIAPYDHTLIGCIEKELTKHVMGLNPQVHGTTIRLPLPKPTQELREKVIKQVKTISENAKVFIRQHRKDGMELLKPYKLTKDDEKKLQTNIQKDTDEGIQTITKILDAKLKEINSA
ncbi:hypothetical protein RB653_007750 [Dictyostelium firmibasis]|uniref:Ribosome recycling factor domain-containing protein n=1 Tax=Dictyostelium firmibasis TaxID=79012 RepID=A0AAN7YRS0_9MYCE